MTTQLLVNALVANHDSKTALTLLGQQCERSKDPPLCDQKKALEALPHPTPVTLEVSETCAPAYGDRGEADVRFDGKSISIDDEPVALAEVGRTLAKIFADADRAAEEVGLIRAEPPPEEEGGTDTAPRRSVSLSIDAEVGMASARPLLRALSEQDVGTVVLIVRDESGGRKIWPVRLRKKAPSIATKPLPSTPTSPADTGVLALMKTPEELWATIEVYSQKTIIRSWANPEPREQFAPGSFPSTATIRSATTDTSTIYVYGDDAAKWKEVALAAAASCEHTLLVLDDPHP